MFGHQQEDAVVTRIGGGFDLAVQIAVTCMDLPFRCNRAADFGLNTFHHTLAQCRVTGVAVFRVQRCGGVFILHAVERNPGIEAVVHVAAFIADFKLVALARFEQLAVGIKVGLRRIELGGRSVQAVAAVYIVNCAGVTCEFGF